MPDPRDEVKLLVNGRVFSGWQSVSIRRSIQAIAGGFDLGVTDEWDEEGNYWPILEGDEAQVKVGDESLIRGFVDKASVDISESAKGVSITGRDRSCDLVDCSYGSPAVQLQGQTLKALAERICQEYAIPVVVDPRVAGFSKDVSVSLGEKGFQILDKALRAAGALAMGDGNGGIWIGRPGSARSSTALELGVNIKGVSSSFDLTERFSNYVVKGDLGLTEETSEIPVLFAEGVAHDAGVKRKRVLVLKAEGPLDASSLTRRAQWEATVRAAKSATFSTSVPGWRRRDGSLWALNELVRVHAPAARIENEELLISEVNFTLDPSGGTMTKLSLMRKDAFLPTPVVKDEGEKLRALVQANQK